MADEEIVTEEGTEPTIAPRSLSVDERNKPILDMVGDQAVGATNPADLGAGKFDYTPQTVQSNELLQGTDKTVGELDTSLTPTQVNTEGTAISQQVSAPLAEGKARTISAEQMPVTNTLIPAAVNIEGQLSNQAQIDAALVQDSRTKEQMLAQGTLATAQTQALAQEATVQFQVGQMYEALEEGKPLPAWAAPNVRKVQEIMNARGLGASSVASAAMVQAIAESAIPIAAQDAQRYATLQIQNLTNQQQTALANAASVAAMDARNLDNRMKAAQQNAQSFLQMDLADFNAEQAGSVLKYQSQVQSLFTEAAAENARLQFNAKSQTQIDQFYDQLGASISKNNADRETATRQFNVDQGNSMAKYAAKIEDAREKFNSSMQLQIDQSNTLWRRTLNTENTAGQNEENRLNAASLLGMTATAQNNLWQKYRDESSFVFQSTQNDLQRTHQLAQTAIANQFARDMFDAEIDAKTNEAIGGFVGSTLQGVFSKAVSSLTKGLFT